MQSDISIKSVRPYFIDAKARTPLKFGAVVMDTVKLAYVKATVENGQGKTADGWGAMFMADMWGWPTAKVESPQRSAAMVETTKRICRLFEQHGKGGHPVDIHHDLEAQFQPIADEVCTGSGLREMMPHLCVLICASCVDAAVHDAFGIVNDGQVWQMYGPDFCSSDLRDISAPT